MDHKNSPLEEVEMVALTFEFQKNDRRSKTGSCV